MRIVNLTVFARPTRFVFRSCNMARRKKGVTLTAPKALQARRSLRKPSRKPKVIEKELISYTKSWIESVRKIKQDYELDEEIMDIPSDDDEDEIECNLKELEKPLKQLLHKYPDSFIRKRVKLECEWGKCSFETTEECQYENHVLDHLTAKNLETSEGDSVKCQWNLCKFTTEDRKELLRHLDYHAYHTRLKTFGWGLADTITIPNCHNDSKFRNDIPPIPNDYFCYWGACSFSNSTYTEYLDHVNTHIKLDYEKSLWAENVKVDCRWDGCNSQIPYMQLKRHLKTHTNEKMIGCANCGALFINKPLFINHCIRQAVNQRSFQCIECIKDFPTKKLLNDHTRTHVHKFRCSFCGMSLQKKSTLAKHIRYRHMTEKPFPCEACDYKAKSKSDLESHRRSHKPDKDLFTCQHCNYFSKTLQALKRHDAKVHLGQAQIYRCHCCKLEFLRGNFLSNHLKEAHNFKLAPGHSRFIYKQDFDGFYRLQRHRVENLKESQPLAVAVEEDSDLDVSYVIDFENMPVAGTSFNIKMKKVTRPKAPTTPALLTEESAEDSKDIMEFAIVKKYRKILKKETA